MTDSDFHARRTELANAFAAAGAELLEFMGAPGTLAAIPNTSPEQYAVAGDLAAIQALLPNRRMRHGQRPTEPLYWGAEAGEPRRWTLLITSQGHGLVGEHGEKFEHGKPEHERVDVVEVVATPPATTVASTVLTDEQIETVPLIKYEMMKTAYETELTNLRNSSKKTVLTDERISAPWVDLQWNETVNNIRKDFDEAFPAEVAAQAGQVAVPGWISVDERLPDAGHCLATYRNSHGKLRIIRAKYARQFEVDAGDEAIDNGNCEYNDEDDTFYLKAGWLECIDNWDDYSSVYVTEGEVTHWMPLPPSPAKESK